MDTQETAVSDLSSADNIIFFECRPNTSQCVVAIVPISNEQEIVDTIILFSAFYDGIVKENGPEKGMLLLCVITPELIFIYCAGFDPSTLAEIVDNQPKTIEEIDVLWDDDVVVDKRMQEQVTAQDIPDFVWKEFDLAHKVMYN